MWGDCEAGQRCHRQQQRNTGVPDDPVAGVFGVHQESGGIGVVGQSKLPPESRASSA
ncbi:hypothetical protein LV779_25705 [Streptomyces thinghirensis]|nr:hypothetical protein [Streptomyces thinghirensis]